jgi:hypothetical protein
MTASCIPLSFTCRRASGSEATRKMTRERQWAHPGVNLLGPARWRAPVHQAAALLRVQPLGAACETGDTQQ